MGTMPLRQWCKSPAAPQLILRSSALITGDQRARSASILARNCAGVVGIGSMSWVANFARIAGSPSAPATTPWILAMIGSGVRAGAISPFQASASTSMPASLSVGIVRQQRRAPAERDRQDLHLAGRHVRRHRDRRQAGHLHVVAQHRGHRLRRARIGDVHHRRPALERDRLHGEMRQRAVADRAVIVFAGVLLQQLDQLADAVDAEARHSPPARSAAW